MSITPGTTLSGRYRLEARVAAGGMSTVYRAVDETLERVVAIKLMHREVATDSDQLERFRREARAVAQLSHPNVVGVIDTGEDDGRPYIVLEYVDGETLKDRIRRDGPLPVPEAVAYAIEIARALGAAHDRHIIHRDVKPQNVLINHEGLAKVTDFGIARTLEEDGLTADGRVLGTTDYVSPEQALGRPVTGRSDLYSLGIVLYEMLTGEVPFRGDNQVAVAMKHVREELPDVQVKRPEISAALASVVDTATAKRETERYADDRELIADLEDVLGLEAARAGSAGNQATTVLRALPAGERRGLPLRVRSRGAAAALVLLVAAIVALVALFLVFNAHNGGGGAGSGTAARGPATATPRRISVCAACARDYNPDAPYGPKTQNPQLDGYAVDGKTSTAWQTQIYYSGLQKPGVGLYVSVHPVAAASLHLSTATPGYTVAIYGARTTPDANAFTGWTKLGGAAHVGAAQTIHLRPAGVDYRYYLVWITSLGSLSEASINEITLST